MTISRIAAFLYAIVTLAVVAFQIALAAGAPWGAFAMGGAFPRQFPPAMRIAAIVTYLWGSKTLAQFRFARSGDS